MSLASFKVIFDFPNRLQSRKAACGCSDNFWDALFCSGHSMVLSMYTPTRPSSQWGASRGDSGTTRKDLCANKVTYPYLVLGPYFQGNKMPPNSSFQKVDCEGSHWQAAHVPLYGPMSSTNWTQWITCFKKEEDMKVEDESIGGLGRLWRVFGLTMVKIHSIHEWNSHGINLRKQMF